jgi:hypothetical protein
MLAQAGLQWIMKMRFGEAGQQRGLHGNKTMKLTAVSYQ